MIGKIAVFICFVSLFAVNVIAKNIDIKNNVGVKMSVLKTDEGYAFGSLYLNGNLVEESLSKGMLSFRNIEDNKVVWLFAEEMKKISELKAVFSGSGKVNGELTTFIVTIEAPQDIKAIKITYDFSVAKDIDNYQACLQFHTDFSYKWKCHMYPWAEDSKFIQRDPLNWMGIPSLFQYRDDMSLGMLWGIDPNSDYLNPTTWTKDFGLYFIDDRLPSQYRVGGKGLKSSINYHCPMHIVLTDNSDPDEMIIDLVQEWIALTGFKVDPLNVRTNDEALDKFLIGRSKTSMWYPGKGYRLEMGDSSSAFIYIGEQGFSSLFEYKIYELTGNPLWRQRSFEQLDFISGGQNTNPEDPNYGYIHTAYSLVDYGPAGEGFNSYDRGTNIGYKVDLNIYLGRYILHMWELVKEHEGIDRQDWYNMAIMAIDWGVRQQNSDGGLPQKLEMLPTEKLSGNDWMGTGQPQHVKYLEPGQKSISTTSGRALPALWNIYQITGNPKYKRVMEDVEKYHLISFQDKFLYNSHHPDLPPHTLEEASIWGICEYWLNRYDDTKDKEYLKHAEANAYLSLTWKCPKQLSWVDNPTQLGSSEQQYFLQYSIYCYQNRQVECLDRLYNLTGNKLFNQLAERVTQNIYWTQVADGDLMGATHERIADPWLARDEGKPSDFNSMGTVYMSEQSLDLLLQVIERYRIGKQIYMTEDLENKIYPDGTCYYSHSIVDSKVAPLKAIPSKGFIKIAVEKWEDNSKMWVVKEASEPEANISYNIGSLESKTYYNLMKNGNEIGSYQADSDGKIAFSSSGDFSTENIFELKKK